MKLTYKTEMSIGQINKVLNKKAYRNSLIRAVMIAIRNGQDSALVYKDYGTRFKLQRTRTGLRNPLLRSFCGTFTSLEGETTINGSFRLSLTGIFILVFWFTCVLTALVSYILTVMLTPATFEAKPFLISFGFLAAGALVTYIGLRSSRTDEREIIKFFEKDLKAWQVTDKE